MKLIKFSASWCQPCKALQETLDQMVIPHTIRNVDIDEDPAAAGVFGIRGVPTLILVTDDGKEQGRLVGLKTKAEIMEWLS